MKFGFEFLIFGRVQGVWFRGSTQLKARELDLTGWVKNNAEGTVSLRAFGTERNLKVLIDWLWSGPKHAIVEKVEKWEIDFEMHSDFEIRR